ncbi:rap1 GTPase-activating protein 1-like isoform X2 [Watersipora subatra]|uniref:rap1 GTPase-activating protein 1-like isoform X2 n=1 Tax=Watersipora subatra TaxID=2589382 RepID=UPI00355AED47
MYCCCLLPPSRKKKISLTREGLSSSPTAEELQQNMACVGQSYRKLLSCPARMEAECDVILNPKNYPTRPKKGGVDEPLYCDSHRKPVTNGAMRESDNTLDLFDLIARTQNSRIDDQRAELPGIIQKCRSVSHLNSEAQKSTDHERVAEMIRQTRGPYPQVMEPMTGGYWAEGFIDKRQSDSDNMLRTADLDMRSFELLRGDCLNHYKRYFVNQEHQNYLAQDDIIGPVVVSIKKEHHPDAGKLYRTIVRTKVNTVHELVRSDGEATEPSVQGLTKVCNDSITTNKFYPVTTLEASHLVKEFDDRFISRNFKFGVIYQAAGQTKEEQFFGNKSTSPAFKEFLEQIGQRVPLQGFHGFRGGLDTIKGQTGAESIHTDFEGREIMFHVSTMLPYTDGDTQQLQRKRHIGNDIVAIVFQEESTPFVPNSIASQFLHAFVIIQPVEACTDNTRYKISVAARTDVPNSFGPMLPKSKLVRKDQLREFLLTKLLNAEYACHNAPQFKDKMERTKLAYLAELHEELLKMTLDSWCGLPSVAQEKATINLFDSFKKIAVKRINDTTYNTKRSTSSTTSSEGSKTPTQEHKITKLPYSHKKMHSEIVISSHSASWDRNPSAYNKTWNESTSLASYRSRGSSYKSDSNSMRSDSSPKDTTRAFKSNGRSSSPTSLGSFGVEDDDGFLAQEIDSDTGVGSMSPTETPHGTWETRINVSKSFNGSPSPCSRCPNCDPDLDYVALLKREILELRKSKSQYSTELHNLKAETQELTKRDRNNRTDLKDKTKQNLKLQHQLDELKNQNQSYRTELSKLQKVVAGMSGEEIV